MSYERKGIGQGMAWHGMSDSESEHQKKLPFMLRFAPICGMLL
jgi:hypothetical protein